MLIEQVLEMMKVKSVRHINQGMKDTFNKMKALRKSANNKIKLLFEGYRVSQMPNAGGGHPEKSKGEFGGNKTHAAQKESLLGAAWGTQNDS